MKTRLVLCLIATLALSTAAVAHETHALTRADVIAEYLAAKAAGTLPPSGDNYPGDQDFRSTKTRAQVIAETRTAIAQGDIAVGEQYPAQAPATSAPGKTRAQVQQELAEAKRSPDFIREALFSN